MKDNTGMPVSEYSRLKDKKLCKLINDKYNSLLMQIEEILDITQCNLEKIKERYGESSEYLKIIGVNKTELLNEFYQIVNSFTEKTINENLYGLEFIRIAFILLASLDNKNMNSYLATIHIHLKWGLDLINQKILPKDSVKSRLLQFI